MFLQALESAAELQSLECVAVVLRTNRTATRRSTRLWRSSRRSRSFLAPAPLPLPLHPNPAPCLQEHPGAQPHPHPHPQVSHRLLSTLWGLSCNLCCLHTNTHLLPTPPTSPAEAKCNMCGCAASQLCPSCNNQLLCDACDDLFHHNPSRANHKREKVAKSKEGAMSLMFPVFFFPVFSWGSLSLFLPPCRDLQYLWHRPGPRPVLHLRPEAVFEM